MRKQLTMLRNNNNKYLVYFNVYISDYFLKRPQIVAMQKIAYFQSHQSSSNHGAYLF